VPNGAGIFGSYPDSEMEEATAKLEETNRIRDKKNGLVAAVFYFC